MAVAFQHANGPGQITGQGRNGTPLMDFERLTTGQLVFVSVEFVITAHSGPIEFEIIAADSAALPQTSNKGTINASQLALKRAIFKVTKESDPAVGVVDVPFEVNFLGGTGTWENFTIIGETTAAH